MIKLLENVLLLGRRDADSAVADLDLHVVAATPAAHHHRSLVRIANSIGDKVAEQTMQQQLVADHDRSSLDGAIQYIQLRETKDLDRQHRLAGLILRSTHNGVIKEFIFPMGLPDNATANETVLIGTNAGIPYDSFPYCVTGARWSTLSPDFTMPDRFLPIDGGTIDVIGVDRFS